MASLTEEIADALARDVIQASKELGDDNLITEISRVIGASSTTTQEAFMTAVRVRLSEQRARQILSERLGPRYAEFLAENSGAPAAVQAPAPRPARAVAPAAETAEFAKAEPQKPAKARSPDARARPIPVESPMASSPGLSEPPQAAFVAAAQTPSRAAIPRDPPAALASDASVAVPGVKPRMAANLERPALTPHDNGTTPASPGSLAAALALPASLPRRPASPADPRPAVTPNYPDIEIPDGDWG